MQKTNDKSRNRVASIFNFAPHYRLSIFQYLAKDLNMDFYFGTRLLTDIKPINYSELSGFKTLLPTKYFKRFYYNKGLFTLFRKKIYTKIILTGEVKNLSAWLALFMKCFNPNIRVMLWMHGWYGNEKGLDRIVKLWMYRWADHLFLYGNYAKELLIEEGIPASKLTVVYNSLDTDAQREICKTLNKEDIYKEHFKNDYPTLIYVGRLQKVKRIDWLIKVIVELERQNLFVNLILIGEGELRKDLEISAKAKSVDSRVWFYGPSYDEETLAKFLYNATVCVSPGNVGLTAMHAMAYGCPVITHDNFQKQMPEFEAIEPGLTGDFYHDNDLDNLIHVVSKWIEKSKNEAFREEATAACQRVISTKYNTKTQVKAFKDILNQ